MKHTRTLGLLVLLMGFTLSVVGCAASEKTPENEPTPMPMPMVVVTRMAALRIEPLTMVDGCLRVGDDEASNLVVWPPDFEVSIENDIIRVLYDDHEVEVQLGQVVHLSGGEVRSREAFDERTRQQIPAGCPGPYWLVGGISPVEETERPGTSATPMPHNPGVADLLRDPAAPGETVEVDAYFSGAGAVLSPEGPIPRPDEVACPTWWPLDAALTDRQFPAILVLPNAITNNTLPDDAPWLVATQEEATKPGVRRAPQLPYHARLRGHLGDSAFAHCPHADRIFLVEEVVKVYEKEPSAPAAYQLELPEVYANWPRHHDADLGYSLPYPHDWRVESLAEPDVLSAIALRAPQWPDNPVVVRVHDGETRLDPADPASRPPLLEGMGYSPIQQGLTSLGEKVRDSQRLTGYQVDREADPGQREAAILFSAQGRTYELALCYPIGLNASQPLLTTYAAIVEGFRLDTP